MLNIVEYCILYVVIKNIVVCCNKRDAGRMKFSACVSFLTQIVSATETEAVISAAAVASTICVIKETQAENFILPASLKLHK